jgi:tRNA(Arg) A34 adenosine deaminase TadA
MNKRILEKAIQEAKKSEHNQRVGAVIFDKNKIVSCGHNYPQKSVRSITKKFINWPNSVHGEIDALIKARTDVKGMSILVVRINKSGLLRLAKPCEMCYSYLCFVGIKKIFYSTEEEIRCL